MRPSKRSLLLGVFVLIAAAVSVHVVSGQPQVSFQEIEESLTCQCGCGLTVHSCNHLQCGSALPLRDEIRAQMAEGKDKTAILAHFRDKYGEKILSAPTTEGFNILAWVTPFVLVGMGGLIVAFTLARWLGRSPTPPSAPGGAGEQLGSAYDQKMENELKNFDG